MIVESSFRGWEDARIVLSERGDFYTDYRRELGEKNFLILPGVEATAVLFDDEGNTVRLHHMNGILLYFCVPAAFHESHSDSIHRYVSDLPWKAPKE